MFPKLEDRWNARFGQLKKYKAEHGHCRVPRSDRELGVWTQTQRAFYTKSRLSQERIDALNKVGFIWTANEASWLARFEELKDHLADKEIGSFPQTKRLAAWVYQQRKIFRDGKMREKRKRMLTELGVDLDPTGEVAHRAAKATRDKEESDGDDDEWGSGDEEKKGESDHEDAEDIEETKTDNPDTNGVETQEERLHHEEHPQQEADPCDDTIVVVVKMEETQNEETIHGSDAAAEAQNLKEETGSDETRTATMPIDDADDAGADNDKEEADETNITAPKNDPNEEIARLQKLVADLENEIQLKQQQHEEDLLQKLRLREKQHKVELNRELYRKDKEKKKALEQKEKQHKKALHRKDLERKAALQRQQKHHEKELGVCEKELELEEQRKQFKTKEISRKRRSVAEDSEEEDGEDDESDSEEEEETDSDGQGNTKRRKMQHIHNTIFAQALKIQEHEDTISDQRKTIRKLERKLESERRGDD